jgi:single-strand DNA-binding protein
MLNQAQIIGRVGRDPEVRYLPSGEAVANFSLATSEKWKDKATGEPREETEWHRISTFGRLAEIVGEYVKKGALVYVSGKIKTRSYEQNGETKYATEIRANEMKMLSGRNDGERQHGDDTGGYGRPQAQRQQTQQRPAPAASKGGFDDMDDDIPF